MKAEKEQLDTLLKRLTKANPAQPQDIKTEAPRPGKTIPPAYRATGFPLAGMTVNERFSEIGLLESWDGARKRKDRAEMIELLGRVELSDQAEQIVDTLLMPQSER
jgi:hypothetical protein